MAIRATGPRAYQFLSPSYGVSRAHGLALSALIRLPARDFFAAPTPRIDSFVASSNWTNPLRYVENSFRYFVITRTYILYIRSLFFYYQVWLGTRIYSKSNKLVEFLGQIKKFRLRRWKGSEVD